MKSVGFAALSSLLAAVLGYFLAMKIISSNDHEQPSEAPPASPATAEIPTTPTPAKPRPDVDGVYHVFPGNNIQDVVELAAADPRNKHIVVHAGTYRPFEHGQAMIWLHRQHDGVVLEAEGRVILTAANPAIADPHVESYPAVVNHVIYFGDGISRATVLRGFEITGANNYTTKRDHPGPIQPETTHPNLTKEHVFYKDGGGIKIWGRSYPTVENVEIYDNYTIPCGAALSVENRGFIQDAPLFKNCVFRNNLSQITGAAIDLYGPGNALELVNCLFVGNISNRGINYFSFPERGTSEEHGSGAVTVFPGCRLIMQRCTFTANYNGINDLSKGNLYEDCIFWNNNAKGGTAEGGRYEVEIHEGNELKNCFIGGDTIHDLHNVIDRKTNTIDAPDPQFDARFVPQNPLYEGVGYRPPNDS